MTINRCDPPLKQRLDLLLDQFIPEENGLDSPRVVVSEALGDALAECENLAVREHGRAILATIEGTTFSCDEGSRTVAGRSDSSLVRLVDEVSA